MCISVYTKWDWAVYGYTPGEDGKSTKSMWDSQADPFLSTAAARHDDEWLPTILFYSGAV